MTAPFLIADDSVDKIHMLQHFLKLMHWKGEVLTAETCQQAYDLIKKHADIAYAFVDFYIPNDNGPAIMQALKNANPACRIALVSSADNAENAALARAAGAEEVVCSTHRSDEVERQVLALLEIWQGDGSPQERQ